MYSEPRNLETALYYAEFSIGDGVFAYRQGYENGSAYVELCDGPLMNYYNNGIIEDGRPNKNELSGDFFPYSVYIKIVL